MNDATPRRAEGGRPPNEPEDCPVDGCAGHFRARQRRRRPEKGWRRYGTLVLPTRFRATQASQSKVPQENDMTRFTADQDTSVATPTRAERHIPHLNRAQLLAAGAGLVLAAVPTMAMVDTAAAHEMSGTAASETIQDILDVLVTMGRFGVAAI